MHNMILPLQEGNEAQTWREAETGRGEEMDGEIDEWMDRWKNEEEQHNLSSWPKANLQHEPIHFFLFS